jgi:hypothetical protein
MASILKGAKSEVQRNAGPDALDIGKIADINLIMWCLTP